MALLVTAQLVGPILGSTLDRLGPLVLNGTPVLFPISDFCGEAISEVYGHHLARQVIWITFGCQVLSVLATALVEVLQPFTLQGGPGGLVLRLVLVGQVANLAGELVIAGIWGPWRFKTAYEALALPISLPSTSPLRLG